MKLRLTLLLMCLFGTGLFADAQTKKKTHPKPQILVAPDEIPVIVVSTKKAHPRKPVKSAVKPIKKYTPVKPTNTEFVKPVKVEKLLQNVKA